MQDMRKKNITRNWEKNKSEQVERIRVVLAVAEYEHSITTITTTAANTPYRCGHEQKKTQRIVPRKKIESER